MEKTRCIQTGVFINASFKDWLFLTKKNFRLRLFFEAS